MSLALPVQTGDNFVRDRAQSTGLKTQTSTNKAKTKTPGLELKFKDGVLGTWTS